MCSHNACLLQTLFIKLLGEDSKNQFPSDKIKDKVYNEYSSTDIFTAITIGGYGNCGLGLVMNYDG